MFFISSASGMLIEYDARSHPIDTGGAIEARSWFALVDVHLTVSAFGAKKQRLDHSQIFLHCYAGST